MSAAPYVQWPNKCAKAGGGLIILVGVLVLLGWALDIAVFKSVWPGWTKMSPLAALAFALAGISLWIAPAGTPHSTAAYEEGPSPLRRIGTRRGAPRSSP